MIRHKSITVSGRVQGVFFRVTTRNKADELGIRGFVKNLPDGSVYIEAEGDDDQMNVFESWCRTGPPRAQVVRTIVKEGNMKHFSDFSVK